MAAGWLRCDWPHLARPALGDAALEYAANLPGLCLGLSLWQLVSGDPAGLCATLARYRGTLTGRATSSGGAGQRKRNLFPNAACSDDLDPARALESKSQLDGSR